MQTHLGTVDLELARLQRETETKWAEYRQEQAAIDLERERLRRRRWIWERGMVVALSVWLVSALMWVALGIMAALVLAACGGAVPASVPPPTSTTAGSTPTSRATQPAIRLFPSPTVCPTTGNPIRTPPQALPPSPGACPP